MYKPSELGQFLVCNRSSSVGLCMQNNKSLCLEVVICATLVNTQTHRQTAFHQSYSASQQS